VQQSLHLKLSQSCCGRYLWVRYSAGTCKTSVPTLQCHWAIS